MSAHAQMKWHFLQDVHGRVEDLSIRDTKNLLVCDGGGYIYRSSDGGQNWDTVFTSRYYLRSIEWLNDSVAFCGSLDSSVFRTTDGGATWTDITSNLPRVPKGICGMDVRGNTVYMAGNFFNDGYIFYSSDGGQSFQESSFNGVPPSSLVDINFISTDTGFACGGLRWNNFSSATATLYRTVDGGQNWDEIFRDYDTLNTNLGWKIFHDGNYMLMSMERNTAGRFLLSKDRGTTWDTVGIHGLSNGEVQGIGLLHPDTVLLGYHLMGGSHFLKMSLATHQLVNVTNAADVGKAGLLSQSHMNRIVRLSDELFYGGGNGVWALYDSTVTSLSYTKEAVHEEQTVPEISIFPNPVRNGELKFRINVPGKTRMLLGVFDVKGKPVEILHNGYITRGEQDFRVSMRGVSQGTYYVVCRSFYANVVVPFQYLE
ncbi:MAG TPA: hypothetical protein DCG19_11765 [Cryomorphaceae bacterium]|nr:hypothetical protein [Owenweeksia sp.]MBG00093.1 hypothetical protein [Owenweeksia sp.]HAD98076.1 hypothetical protein [Cryomorphaceae bacterium]HBF21948.1 hypothetical protein [Cryomorphaceae bacterium]